MTVIRCVMLDVDGTLVDSNDQHARAWVEALAEAGFEISYERVRPLIGMGGDKVLPELTGIDKESDRGTRLSDRRGEIFKGRYLPHLKPFPGARDLLLRLKADGVRLVVASSAGRDELDVLLKIAGAADLVEETTSSSDAEHSKPDPDLIQATLETSGCAPDGTLMLGDTAYDIEAAGKAGVRTIALRCGGWDDDSLRGALAIYDDPADLLAHYDESPLRAQPAATGTRGAQER